MKISPNYAAVNSKMNKYIRLIGISAVSATALILVQTNTVRAEKVSISGDSQPNPLTLNGTSGGATKSNCGNLPTTANHTIEIKEALRLNFSVESSGEPTLLIEGPGGRFCALSDSYSDSQTAISGYWIPGNYTIHVGQSSQSQSPYTLSITQPKK